MEQGEKTISNVEWGLFLGALALIDLCQIGLELAYGIGLVVGPFIDAFVGGWLLLYCKLRGIRLSRARLASIGAAFVINATPLQGAWITDGIYIMASVKAEEAVAKYGGMLGNVGKIAKKAIDIYNGKVSPKDITRS